MIFKEYSVKFSLKNIKKWADDSESSQTSQKKSWFAVNRITGSTEIKNQIDLITW